MQLAYRMRMSWCKNRKAMKLASGHTAQFAIMVGRSFSYAHSTCQVLLARPPCWHAMALDNGVGAGAGRAWRTAGMSSGVPFMASSAAKSMMVDTGANSSWSTSSFVTTAPRLVGRLAKMCASRNCAPVTTAAHPCQDLHWGHPVSLPACCDAVHVTEHMAQAWLAA